jgi:hypothetical protein
MASKLGAQFGACSLVSAIVLGVLSFANGWVCFPPKHAPNLTPTAVFVQVFNDVSHRSDPTFKQKCSFDRHYVHGMFGLSTGAYLPSLSMALD